MNLPNDLPSRMRLARVRYGMSCAGMSSVLGFGINQWSLYERGREVNSVPHQRLIAMALDPYSFLKLLEAIPVGILGQASSSKVMLNTVRLCNQIDELLRRDRERHIYEIFTPKNL